MSDTKGELTLSALEAIIKEIDAVSYYCSIHDMSWVGTKCVSCDIEKVLVKP